MFAQQSLLPKLSHSASKRPTFGILERPCSLEEEQGPYNSGKPGKHENLREFVNSGKFRENSGNLKYNQGILVRIILDAIFFVTQSVTHNKPTCKFVWLQLYLRHHAP